MATATVHAISAEGIRIIRAAAKKGSLNIQHYNGTSRIHAYTDDGMRELTEIEVGHEFKDYSEKEFGPPVPSAERSERFSCYTSLCGYRYDDGPLYWVLRQLRPGDFLTIRWERGVYQNHNRGDGIDRERMVQDVAYLIVRRPVKGSDSLKRVGVYFLEDRISPHDSSARMIRLDYRR